MISSMAMNTAFLANKVAYRAAYSTIVFFFLSRFGYSLFLFQIHFESNFEREKQKEKQQANQWLFPCLLLFQFYP
jgi:hypothetical protein